MAYAAQNTSKAIATERQIRLALYIRKNGPVTRSQIEANIHDYAPDTGRNAETARRMFERDKRALANEGLVISSDCNGCYTIDASQSVCAPVNLTRSQATLLRAACMTLINDPGYQMKEELRCAVVKLSEELDAPDALALLNVDSSPVGIARSAEGAPGTLRKIRTAIEGGKRLAFTYCNKAEQTTRRCADPLSIFSRKGHTYLQAFDTELERELVFRLDRMSKVSVSSTNASAHETTSAAFCTLPFQFGEKMAVATVELRGAAAARARILTEGCGALEASADHATWTIECGNFDELASWCIEHGPGIKPVAPAKAAQAFEDGIRLAKEALRLKPQVKGGLPRLRASKPAKSQGMPDEQLLLALFALIERNGCISIPQAAKLLGVSENRTYCALEQLLFAYDSAANIRLELGEPGCAVARLVEDHSNTLRLTATETEALLDALASCGIPSDDPLASILREAKGTANIKSASVHSIDRSDDPALMELLSSACESDTPHMLSIEYLKDGADRATTRLVKPEGLKSQYGYRYLHAWCTKAQAMRDFRLDRIVSAKLTDIPAGRPEHEGTQTAASVALIWIAPGAPCPEWPGASAVAWEDGSHVMRVAWLGSSWLPKQIVAMRGMAVPLEPGDLVDAVTAYADQLLAQAA